MAPVNFLSSSSVHGARGHFSRLLFRLLLLRGNSKEEELCPKSPFMLEEEKGEWEKAFSTRQKEKALISKHQEAN